MPTIIGTAASETLEGGAGDDHIEDRLGGSDILRGNGGNDTLTVYRGNSAIVGTVRMEGGDGDDSLWFGALNASAVIMDGGAGADRFFLAHSRGTITITTGSGVDTIALNAGYTDIVGQITPIVVTDFSTGAGGDILEWSAYLNQTLYNWAGGNPFASGHLSLLQSGARTLLQIDRDGGGNSYTTLFTFENTTATNFTAANLGGIALPGQTITGTGGDDNLTGTGGDDVINGLGGNDVINGLDGADVIDGGAGTDNISGGAGNDTVFFGLGADVLDGGTGDDRFVVNSVGFTSPMPPTGQISGGDGTDTIDATGGSPTSFNLTNQGQTLTVGNQSFAVTGVETFRFGGEANFISLSQAANIPLTFFAGAGADNISIYAGVSVYAEDGNDTVRLSGSFGTAPVTGFADGGSGTDLLSLNISSAADLLAGTVTSGQANFTIQNFEDVTASVAFGYSSTVRGSHTANVIRADGQGLGTAGIAVFHGEGGDDTLVGEANADTLNGDDGDDVIDGRAGNDAISGGVGNDTLYGGEGNDTIAGGAGNDAASGGAGDDVITGDAGADTLNGDDGNDILNGGTGSDALNGGAGSDTASYAGSTTGVEIYLDSQITWDGTSTDFLNSIENATGSDHSDYMVGTSAANVLTGGAGSDFLFGMAGDDLLIGGSGVDRLVGGDGVDTITYAGSAAGVEVYLDNGISWDGTSMDFLETVENVTGSDHADYFVGSTSANVLIGGAGNDFLFGMAGDDLLVGGSGVDRLVGGDGVDTITYAGSAAGVEVYLDNGISWDGTSVDFLETVENVVGSSLADYMVGSATANVLTGGAGDDTLYGMAGDDVLNGGSGVDQLFGDDGIDTVTYAGSATGVEIYLNNGVSWDGSSTDFLNSIENVIGSDHADYIVGTAGANVIDGGAGTDTVLYTGNRAAYTISLSGGVTTITGPDGTDTLTNVERLQFADGLYDIGGNPVAAPAADVPQVLPAQAVDKASVEPEVLPIAPGDFAKENGAEVLPAMADEGVSPEVLPVMDDGFVLTGKFGELPPVMPIMDEFDVTLLSLTEMQQARELMMAQIRENPLDASRDSLILLDDWSGVAPPSRGEAWV
jgi:Ca2+-binding RTX toxin-like protein